MDLMNRYFIYILNYDQSFQLILEIILSKFYQISLKLEINIYIDWEFMGILVQTIILSVFKIINNHN
jgi:hypothetical protein